MINVLLINLNVSSLGNSLHTSIPGYSIQVLRGCRSDFMVSRCVVQKTRGGRLLLTNAFFNCIPSAKDSLCACPRARTCNNISKGCDVVCTQLFFRSRRHPGRMQGEGWIPSGGRLPKHRISRYGIHCKFNVFSSSPLEIATGLIVIGVMGFLPIFSSFTICHVSYHYSQLHNNLHNAEKPAAATKVIYFNNCPIFLWRSRKLHKNSEYQHPSPYNYGNGGIILWRHFLCPFPVIKFLWGI